MSILWIMWKIFKYVMWSLLISFFVFMLIWIHRCGCSVTGYIESLNNKSRDQLWDNGWISGLFNKIIVNETLDTNVDESTWKNIIDVPIAQESTWDWVWLDVYDPEFESDFESFFGGDSDDVKVDTWLDFWFNAWNVSGDDQIIDSNDWKKTLLELIKQRE
jgi:hypothetical protein